MKETYRACAFTAESLDRIATADKILTTYAQQGLRLTLRQLYYQFVAHHALPNTERSYKNLGELVSKARLAGKLDWEAIEDRVRQPQEARHWSSPAAFADAAVGAYRLPRWEGQEHYAELWVEKDALAGVLSPLAREYHVTLMVNRGYSSQSAMYESAQRFLAADRDSLKLFYLGDHDPSGEDMVRDVGDRLAMFGVRDLEVRKLALTMEQVRRYKPPPNPAKMTDSRANAYVAEHGRQSWEVDALPPQVLQQIIRDAFDAIVDREAMDVIIEREKRHKDALRRAAKRIAKDAE